jgi:hypothetical protein
MLKIVPILIKKKVPPVNSELLVDLKNIESPVHTCISKKDLHIYKTPTITECPKINKQTN